MTAIPTIETSRLTLRPLSVDDFDAYQTLWTDEEVVRHITGVPSSREQTWARLMRVAGMWHHLGFGFLGIEEKATGRLIGEAGFHDLHRDMKPSIEDTLEMGWALLPETHGRGYATEAVAALIDWAEVNFPGKPMTCIISPENEASLRVAARTGFGRPIRTDYHGEVILLTRP